MAIRRSSSRVLDVLRAAGAEVRDDESRLLVTGGDDLFDVVRDAVVDAGAGIRRLQPRTVSLEDVFLGVEVSANAQMTAEPLPHELGSPG